MQRPTTIGIRQNYDQQAQNNKNQFQRQQKQTSDLLKFNNWIKSVLISKYSKEMCHKLQSILDMPRVRTQPLLHVLDIGCGRGQDIKKWKIARVRYMVATDFSSQSLKQYRERWRTMGQPFKLYTISADFTKYQLLNQIQHSYYDIVSAQFCLHYMFGTGEGLKYGLCSALSNLLVGGVFFATIPDSYVILKMINQKGQKKDNAIYYGNKYFSLKFTKTIFTEPYGNQYGFYLQDAVGSKDKQTGQIYYTNQWLISLDKLAQNLRIFGVEIQYTKNFIQFYLENRNIQQYRSLFGKMGLHFDEGKAINQDLWELAHLYRVLVCRKTQRVGKDLHEYSINSRLKATQDKQIKRSWGDGRGGDKSRGSHSHHSHQNRSSRHSTYKKHQHRN